MSGTTPSSTTDNGQAGLSRVAAELIRSRRTIHLFEPDLPPRSALLRAIDLGRWAPNHRLTEPWRFYLLGAETAEAIAQVNAEIVAEARGHEAGQAKLAQWRAVPGWMVVTCLRSEEQLRQQEDYAACCCAVQNVMLYLWSEGIGTKWTTGNVTRDPRFFRLLQIDPEKEMLVSMLWYGYPAQIPSTQRKPSEEIVEERP